MRALAAAWDAKFAIATQEPQLYQSGLAFVGVAAGALAYELSGRSVLAPWAALCVAAADLYVLRPEAEQSRVDASFALMENPPPPVAVPPEISGPDSRGDGP